MSIAVEVQGLKKSFTSVRSLSGAKKIISALNGLTLSIQEGETFALIGPNGSGKTTFIRILSNLIIPEEGLIRIWDRDLLKDFRTIVPQMGLLISDDRSFYWRLSGRQNLEFFAALYNLTPEQTSQKIGAIAEMLRIGDLDQPFQEYSSGNKQKLALARTLLTDTPFLMMDEPTRSLDPVAALNFMKMVRTLAQKQKKTLLFTTHRLEEAECFSDRIGILGRGKLLGCGTLNDLRSLAEGETQLERIFEKLTAGAQ